MRDWAQVPRSYASAQLQYGVQLVPPLHARLHHLEVVVDVLVKLDLGDAVPEVLDEVHVWAVLVYPHFYENQSIGIHKLQLCKDQVVQGLLLSF